jgi:hypothetical protein
MTYKQDNPYRGVRFYPGIENGFTFHLTRKQRSEGFPTLNACLAARSEYFKAKRTATTDGELVTAR